MCCVHKKSVTTSEKRNEGEKEKEGGVRKVKVIKFQRKKERRKGKNEGKERRKAKRRFT